MQCALGLSQMSRLDDYVAKRNEIAHKYHNALSQLSLKLPSVTKDCHSAYHLYVIQLSDDQRDRRSVFEFLRAQNIGVNVHYIPVCNQPYYQALGFKKGYCKNAQAYYDRAISLPMFPTMTEEQFDYVVKMLGEALS